MSRKTFLFIALMGLLVFGFIWWVHLETLHHDAEVARIQQSIDMQAYLELTNSP